MVFSNIVEQKREYAKGSLALGCLFFFLGIFEFVESHEINSLIIIGLILAGISLLLGIRYHLKDEAYNRNLRYWLCGLLTFFFFFVGCVSSLFRLHLWMGGREYNTAQLLMYPAVSILMLGIVVLILPKKDFAEEWKEFRRQAKENRIERERKDKQIQKLIAQGVDADLIIRPDLSEAQMLAAMKARQMAKEVREKLSRKFDSPRDLILELEQLLANMKSPEN